MLRGDGKLNLDIAVSDSDKAPQDQCGVFGVWAPGEEVAKLTFFGLYALQHRGQESAGIATSDGKKILVYKDMGLVSQVFSESALESLIGHIAVGHNRYSTTGASHWRNAQPTLGRTSAGTVALAHNGNLTNTADLLDLLKARYPNQGTNEITGGNTTDTAVLTALLAGDQDTTLENTALELLPKVKGAFCLVFMDEKTLYAARDPQGVRPLVLGRLERGHGNLHAVMVGQFPQHRPHRLGRGLGIGQIDQTGLRQQQHGGRHLHDWPRISKAVLG